MREVWTKRELTIAPWGWLWSREGSRFWSERLPPTRPANDAPGPTVSVQWPLRRGWLAGRAQSLPNLTDFGFSVDSKKGLWCPQRQSRQGPPFEISWVISRDQVWWALAGGTLVGLRGLGCKEAVCLPEGAHVTLNSGTILPECRQYKLFFKRN